MSNLDYRHLKKRLNKYHNFSFKMPRKGVDFTPQQKSAISRVFNRLKPALKSLAKETNGYLPLTKSQLKKLGPNFDYRVKTNKGVFTKFANPKLYKSKKLGLSVGAEFGLRREIFFPFPLTVITMDDIKEYVDELMRVHDPDYVRWSVNGYAGSALYDPEVFNLYVNELDDDLEEDGKKYIDNPFFNGVFLGWAPETKIRGKSLR